MISLRDRIKHLNLFIVDDIKSENIDLQYLDCVINPDSEFLNYLVNINFVLDDDKTFRNHLKRNFNQDKSFYVIINNEDSPNICKGIEDLDSIEYFEYRFTVVFTNSNNYEFLNDESSEILKELVIPEIANAILPYVQNPIELFYDLYQNQFDHKYIPHSIGINIGDGHTDCYIINNWVPLISRIIINRESSSCNDAEDIEIQEKGEDEPLSDYTGILFINYNKDDRDYMKFGMYIYAEEHSSSYYLPCLDIWDLIQNPNQNIRKIIYKKELFLRSLTKQQYDS